MPGKLKQKQTAGGKEKPPEFKKDEPGFKLKSEKMFEYRFMIENLFRMYGPSKSAVSVTVNDKARYPLIAGINENTWDVKFVLRGGLEVSADRRLTQYLEKRNIVDPIKEMLKIVSCHEMGHWEYPRGSGFGCPYDKATYYTSFIEPIFEELKASGRFSEAFCKQMSGRLANAISDVIDNAHVSEELASKGQLFSGQVVFWYLQGQYCGQYSPEYSLFVKTNLAVHGTNADYDVLKKFITENAELGKSVSHLKGVFTPENMANQEQWEMLAREYTKEVLKFLDDEPPKHQYSAGDKTSTPPKRQKGDKEKDEDKNKEKGKDGEKQEGEKEEQEGGEQGEDGEPQEGEEEGEGSSGGSQGEEEGEGEGSSGGSQGEDEDEGEGEDEDGSSSGGSQGKEEDEDEGDEEGEGPKEKEPGSDLKQGDIEKIMGGRKAGKGIPFYLKTDEALDGYYRALAKRIKINAAGKLPTAEFPLIPIVREAYNPEVHSSEDIATEKLFVDAALRRLVPSVVKTRLAVDIPLRKEKRNLPDFTFTLLDSSGSMMQGGDKRIVPWGDSSYYHYGLITWYGLLRFFEMERVMHQIKVGGAIFSDSTLTAGGLPEVKKLLLNPATGGTSLDLRKVMDSLKGKKGAMFSMISDGEIGNWDSIKDEFIALAKQHQFFMIQIGRPSQASRDIEAAGLPVYHVNSYEEIVTLAIDLTAKAYRKAIQQKLTSEGRKFRNM